MCSHCLDIMNKFQTVKIQDWLEWYIHIQSRVRDK